MKDAIPFIVVSVVAFVSVYIVCCCFVVSVLQETSSEILFTDPTFLMIISKRLFGFGTVDISNEVLMVEFSHILKAVD